MKKSKALYQLLLTVNGTPPITLLQIVQAMDNNASLKYAVIESREDELRRYIGGIDLDKLNHKELAASYSQSSALYHRDYRKNNGLTRTFDRGYMIFKDEAKNR